MSLINSSKFSAQDLDSLNASDSSNKTIYIILNIDLITVY